MKITITIIIKRRTGRDIEETRKAETGRDITKTRLAEMVRNIKRADAKEDGS